MIVPFFKKFLKFFRMGKHYKIISRIVKLPFTNQIVAEHKRVGVGVVLTIPTQLISYVGFRHPKAWCLYLLFKAAPVTIVFWVVFYWLIGLIVMVGDNIEVRGWILSLLVDDIRIIANLLG